MELQPVTDTAAKQAIDATRAYKEFVRVHRQLAALGGSMFWKPVGSYEYLAQRSGLKVHHLGARSPQTEVQYESFQKERERLRAREKSLQARIKLHERMNHAVHAGAAPTPVLKTLDALEDVGAAADSVVLGPAALLAYWQASGLQPPAAAANSEDAGVWVLLPQKLSAQARRKLHSSKAFQVSEFKLRNTCLLKFSPYVSNHDKHGAKKQSAILHSADALEDTLVPVLPEIEQAPAFEQVVIGKTGKMSLMRTLDPQLFLDLCDTPAGETLGIEAQQGKWVQQLVSQRRVHSRLQAVEPAKSQA